MKTKVHEAKAGSDVQRFAESFQTEAELRERLATLFSKMSGICGVQITHGSQEYGKDIIFYSKDAIGSSMLYACVVKNDKITGAAEGDTSGRNVLIQVEEALDTPHINPSGQEESVAHVYVISPYDCPQTTMRAIKGKLTGRSGQVTFLCGRLLLAKFAEHWPEFVAFETTLVASYMARLEQSFDEADPIAFLMSQHQVLSTGRKGVAKVYVRQRFRRLLQEFELILQVPSATTVAGLTSEVSIGQFAQQLGTMAGLLRHPEAWDVSESNNSEVTAAELSSLAESMRTAWKAEFERFRSDRQRQGDHIPPRHAVQLPVKIDQANLQSLLSRVTTAIGKLTTRLEDANRFARSSKNLLNELGSKSYRGYCDANQIVHLVPTAFRAHGQAREVFLPEDLLDKTVVPLLVTAPAGYGKTSFCKWNFLRDARLMDEAKSSIIPIYVPLHQLATIAVSNITDVFLRSEDVKQLVEFGREQSRKIRFYLDGLDEVSTRDQQRKLMQLASQIPSEYPTAQVIVTGRDYVSGHWLSWLSRINLAELTDEQVKAFIANWLGEDAHELKDFQEQMDKSRTLLPLMRVPLLATLIIAVFKKMRSLPENKIRLYEIFVDLMCGGWDVAKNVRRDTKYGPNAKLSVLTRLAGHLHINERREAEESDIRLAIKESFPASYENWRPVLAELLEDGLLVRLTGGIGFAHLSFQEYLTAKDLTTDPTGERPKLVLRRFLRGQDWWREVLAFYLSMTQRPDELAAWIKSVGTKISHDLRSQDMGKRWDFMMKCLQGAAPGWNPPAPSPLIKGQGVGGMEGK